MLGRRPCRATPVSIARHVLRWVNIERETYTCSHSRLAFRRACLRGAPPVAGLHDTVRWDDTVASERQAPQRTEFSLEHEHSYSGWVLHSQDLEYEGRRDLIRGVANEYGMRREFVELDDVPDDHIQLLRQRGSLDSLGNFGLGWYVLVAGFESFSAGYLPPSWDQVRLRKYKCQPIRTRPAEVASSHVCIWLTCCDLPRLFQRADRNVS